ncbi:outer membrane-stress sensor serine endopeptidase DegS [Pasteurellaceae bacterium Pebbles2]|nr:outer membrane-stress sensor serine endopeptidase DegS [Pasteurellaceae bacterium Pebbles2]
MIKKLLQSALIGLACAALILFVIPKFTGGSAFKITSDVMSFKEAVRIASPAVVNVYNQTFTSNSNLDAGEISTNNLGSGVIMSRDGYILTNKHVIQSADQIIVALQDGRVFEANLIGSDSLTDLAVLKIRADNLTTIPQNAERQVHVGDIALAIGNPYNLGQSVSQGIISATGRNAIGETVGRQNFIQTDASINRGNSGGALINSLGELVGISTLSIGKDSNEIAEGLSFAIPIEIANDVMQKIIRDGRVIRGYFGVQSNILFSNGQGREGVSGILIENVVANGPAAKAGIRAGDVMLKFNNIDATSPAQLMQVISNIKPNTQVNVLISRLGKTIELPVIIEEYPEN